FADVAPLVADDEVLIDLNSRNRRLSGFWLADQAGTPPDARLSGKRAVILDGEDAFVNMLRHILARMGISSNVVRHEDYADGVLDGFDLVIVGPGPGDPRDDSSAKMANLRAAVAWLLANQKPFLAVCLGHQALCHTLGIPLAYKDIVFQGTQSSIVINGRPERVGFYNTFVGRVGPDVALPAGVSVDADAETGDVHGVAGPHYRGVQFHAESILTERGFDIVHDLVSVVLL
ncbi:MAG: aminodeoxychorismate/anthranilate synthase component II, partial [Nocardioidaceae bacterium]|nr:aminodeoxychorismate/anthranilate synthase component II [Nocardioidaceae bacterium]